jgi:branched-chain amino acid transport system permease protein
LPGTIISDVLSLAPLYGVLAAGFVVVYRFTGVLNFAHGALTAFGAYVVYYASTALGANPVLALLGTGLAGAAAGAIVYLLVMRPMNGRPIFATVLITIGLSIVIDSLIVLIWTSSARSLPETFGFATQVHTLGNVTVSTGDLIMWGLYLATLAGLLAALRWSRFGIQGRAAAEEPLLASYRGINIQVVFLVAWTFAGASAFLAGGVYATTHEIVPVIGLLALKSFPAAMVGGLDSVSGTIVGALIIATAESVAIHYVDPRFATIVPYAAMVFLLLLRPWGLWGTREELDRV